MRNSVAATCCACSIRLVVIAGLVAPIVARSADSATGDCAIRAGVFRERLESVTEAAIDGRAAAVTAAADRAQLWWRVHAKSLGDHANVDSSLSRLVSVARGHQASAAAHLAVGLSTASLSWCAGTLSTADQLMVLDLAGMAAWVRAKGIATDEPANSRAVSESVAAALLHAHRTALAARLRTAYSSVQPRADGKIADLAAAIRLLGLVDDIEKVLR